MQTGPSASGDEAASPDYEAAVGYPAGPGVGAALLVSGG
jgi:hypothetical protein